MLEDNVEEGPSVDPDLAALLRRAGVYAGGVDAFCGYSLQDCLDIAGRAHVLDEFLEHRGVAISRVRDAIAKALGKERDARGMNGNEPPPLKEGQHFASHIGLEVGMMVRFGPPDATCEGFIVSLDGDGLISVVGLGQGVPIRLERKHLR